MSSVTAHSFSSWRTLSFTDRFSSGAVSVVSGDVLMTEECWFLAAVPIGQAWRLTVCTLNGRMVRAKALGNPAALVKWMMACVCD